MSPENVQERRIKRSQLPEIRDKLLAAQGNKCAVCKMGKDSIPLSNWCVDHDHKTGLIRGVLCRNCNALEGKIRNFWTRYLQYAPLDKVLCALAVYLENPPVNVSVLGKGLVHHTFKTEDEKRLARNRKARIDRAKKKATGG